MLELDDKIYIQQVLDGSTASFTHLVNKYKNMVYTVAFRILRQAEDAEEVAQDAFIKAFNKLHAFQGDSKFSTWLYTIVYRTAISRTQLKKMDTVSEDFLLEASTDFSSPPLDELIQTEQQYYVKKAIDALPEIDGVVVTLFYMDDLSIQEIMKVTELSESNVKVKLYRSRKQLKENLKTLLQHEMQNFI